MWNYLPDKLKSTENREHLKSMLKRHASHLNSVSFAKEASLLIIRTKILFIFRKFIHSFRKFLFRLFSVSCSN